MAIKIAPDPAHIVLPREILEPQDMSKVKGATAAPVIMTSYDKVKAKGGRPKSGKVVVTLRLSPDVIEKFKATGPGWQARIDEALRRANTPS